jgi:hypothetical protein
MDIRIVRTKEIHFDANPKHPALLEDFLQGAKYQKVGAVNVDLDKIEIQDSSLNTERGQNDSVCRQSISDRWLGNLRECLAHLV